MASVATMVGEGVARLLVELEVAVEVLEDRVDDDTVLTEVEIFLEEVEVVVGLGFGVGEGEGDGFSFVVVGCGLGDGLGSSPEPNVQDP